MLQHRPPASYQKIWTLANSYQLSFNVHRLCTSNMYFQFYTNAQHLAASFMGAINRLGAETQTHTKSLLQHFWGSPPHPPPLFLYLVELFFAEVYDRHWTGDAQVLPWHVSTWPLGGERRSLATGEVTSGPFGSTALSKCRIHLLKPPEHANLPKKRLHFRRTPSWQTHFRRCFWLRVLNADTFQHSRRFSASKLLPSLAQPLFINVLEPRQHPTHLLTTVSGGRTCHCVASS